MQSIIQKILYGQLNIDNSSTLTPNPSYIIYFGNGELSGSVSLVRMDQKKRRKRRGMISYVAIRGGNIHTHYIFFIIRYIM